MGAITAHAQSGLDAQQLAQLNSPQLALQQLQGANLSDDELRLKWQLLAQMDDAEAILQAASTLPKNAPPDVARLCNQAAAHAALQQGNGVLSRSYLAALLADRTLDTTVYQQARAAVVRSYLLPPLGNEVASVMLRYQQDFGKDKALLQSYALAMLQAGRADELKWARSQLDDTDAVAELIDISAGQFTDDQSKLRLQAAILAAKDAARLTLLRKLVSAYNAPDLLAQIDERLLNLPEAQITADKIWEEYRSLTQTLGNVRLLLFGSDAGWADLAKESETTNPMMARAVWAYLARSAKDANLRQTAQQQLLTQLHAAKLDRTALRLFASAWPNLPASVFNADTRYQLGAVAWAENQPAVAVNLWRDLPAPPQAVAVADWQVQRARLFARQGLWPLVADAVYAWIPLADTAVESVRWQMLNVALQMPQDSSALLIKLLPVLNPAQQRVAMQRLGAISSNDKEAATWLLNAAENAHDEAAWQARLDAAARLKKAGLLLDAKQQYQAVLAGSDAAAQRALATDALADF
ncbi:hypothetical protein [Sulfuriferula nivalis]|nr:hypothetical protein [Sulfuriferula nivalis]